jgi:hypothetical protein
VPRPIHGDPLTGTLPATKLVVATDVMGPTRVRRPRPPEWPLVPDAEVDLVLRPGRVAYVRHARGVRRYLIRTVMRSTQPGPNRGRTFVTGMSQRGWCHSFWANRIVSTQSMQQALSAGKVLKAIGTGK